LESTERKPERTSRSPVGMNVVVRENDGRSCPGRASVR
jgi:hypothetical protein